MIKKVGSILSMFVLILTIPVSAFASTGGPQYGAGEWDTILGSTYELWSSSTTRTRTVLSGGGDVRFCVSGVNDGNMVDLDLYSDDVTFDNLVESHSFSWVDRTGSSTSGTMCTGKIDARPYVDGSSAEFYLKMTSHFDKLDTVYITIQD